MEVENFENMYVGGVVVYFYVVVCVVVIVVGGFIVVGVDVVDYVYVYGFLIVVLCG